MYYPQDLGLNICWINESQVIQETEGGLSNLSWMMRKFAVESLGQQELYRYGNAFLVKYAVFTL